MEKKHLTEKYQRSGKPYFAQQIATEFQVLTMILKKVFQEFPPVFFAIAAIIFL